MSDDLEIKVGESEPTVKESPVTITETDGDTIVDLSPQKKEEPRQDDSRWKVAEAENLAIKAKMDLLQYQMQGNQRQDNADPFKQELDNISQRERALGIEWETKRASKSLTQSDIDSYDSKARDLHQQRANIAARKAIQEALPMLQQQQQRTHFQTKHADVHSNQNALAYAKGTYEQLRAMGHQESEALVDRAMNEARRQFGLTGNMSFAPTDQDKRQLMGVSGGGGRQVADNTVKMGKSEKAMAMAMYGEAFNGDENKVYKKWAEKIGIKAKRDHEKAKRNSNQ
jgi:hypothetical protein